MRFGLRETRPSRNQTVGAVAQLGERGLCKPEVVGSIPISSTNPEHDLKRVPSRTARPKQAGDAGLDRVDP